MKKVMVFGTFDLLHQGHLSLFSQAKKHGNYLIAVIARDKTVKELKGKYPKEKENIRKRSVSKYVNKAVLGNITDKFQKLKLYKPDVICLGYDQTFYISELKQKLKEFRLKTKIVRLKPFKPEIYKTSILYKKWPKSTIRKHKT